MSGFGNITLNKARPLPVIILADVSGSMAEHGKIDALNNALREMIRALGAQSRLNAEINIGIITFGGQVNLFQKVQPAYQFETIPTLAAGGGTPFGEAIKITTQLLEDKSLFPDRCYRPTVVAISDGFPTDSWEKPLDELFASERASKCIRLAMAIGPGADESVLKRFIANPEIPVIHGKDARDIEKFFRCVTMTVTHRSVQKDPNKLEQSEIKQIYEEEELDF